MKDEGEKTISKVRASFRRERHPSNRRHYQRPISWVEKVVRPISTALARHLRCDVYFEGPLGMKTRFDLHVPGKDGLDLVWIRSTQKVKGKGYKKLPLGTIIFWDWPSGLAIPLLESTTIAQLAAVILKGHKRMIREL